MKACRLVIILAVSLSAVNAVALQAAFNDTCSDCSNQPRLTLNLEYPRAEYIFQTTTTLASVHVLSSTSIRFSRLKAKEISSSNNASPKLFSGGRAVEGLFGPKIGLRTENVGIFAKVRPGVISFSNTIQGITINPTPPFSFSIQTGRLTEPALDLGTVIEVYPSKHWAWRTDIGDTMVFYRGFSFLVIRVPGTSKNNFQFNTGLQYRF